jgi:hypothetical protein
MSKSKSKSQSGNSIERAKAKLAKMPPPKPPKLTPQQIATQLICNNEFKNYRLMETDAPFTLRDPIYFLNDRQEISLASDDRTIHEKIVAPGLSPSHRQGAEVFNCVKASLNSAGQTIPFEEIHSIGYADDDYIVWSRKTRTRQSLQNHLQSYHCVPEFKQFLDRCDDPMAVVHWIGSLMDPHSNRKQYLHLRGDGDDGKSQLSNALLKAFGKQSAIISAKELLTSPYFGADLEGARLGIFQDENDPGFFSSTDFKNLTGDDSRSVRQIHQAKKQIRLTLKIIITSNSEVRITDCAADKSRLISVNVKTPSAAEVAADPGWGNRLIASREQILDYCYSHYAHAIKNGINVNEKIPTSQANTQAAIIRRYSNLEDAFENKFILDLNSRDRVRCSGAHEMILGNESKSLFKLKELKEFLKLKGVSTSLKDGINYYQGIRIRNLAEGLVIEN